ncbi:hypothetical protein FOPG_04030 [Fusarium oxysporum f. sp. conglutinans race 2 54008]|uniref:Uncharacterized protein n=1 Tax=Fusarium oxysporum f. sp. conglutinans race 2 54008 TaxID=1089457 RepID=X0IGG6_FUSOX|nr:hypothetical protein FOPG_04030 [Fusarium oxysporum f. sp. conglutinans race 2 54008]
MIYCVCELATSASHSRPAKLAHISSNSVDNLQFAFLRTLALGHEKEKKKEKKENISTNVTPVN